MAKKAHWANEFAGDTRRLPSMDQREAADLLEQAATLSPDAAALVAWCRDSDKPLGNDRGRGQSLNVAAIRRDLGWSMDRTHAAILHMREWLIAEIIDA